MKKALTSAGAQTKVVAPRLGFLTGAKGEEVKVDFSLLTASSGIATGAARLTTKAGIERCAKRRVGNAAVNA